MCKYCNKKSTLNTSSKICKSSVGKMKSIFLQVFAVFSAIASALPPPEDTLVLLHVLFRHGNRTPDKMSVFPTSLNINETYAPYGYSQLTPKGKLTEYNIGKYIRERYDKFIPDQYIPNVVESLSTNFKRTKMSLELVLTALFPPLPDDVFTDEVYNWQPIPYDIEDGVGLIGVASAYCPNYISAYYQYVMSKEARDIIAEYKDLYEELTKNAGFDVITPRDVAGIYMDLKCDEDYGLKLPDWSSEVYPAILEEAGAVDYEFATATPKLKKLSAGRLLKKILDDSYARKNGTLREETKIFLYSAHEYNVATMLRTLNVFKRHVPPFGATLFFEIHDINGEYGLKLYYQDYSQKHPRLLIIPGCSSICSLEKLIELIGENLPSDLDTCNNVEELL